MDSGRTKNAAHGMMKNQKIATISIATQKHAHFPEQIKSPVQKFLNDKTFSFPV